MSNHWYWYIACGCYAIFDWCTLFYLKFWLRNTPLLVAANLQWLMVCHANIWCSFVLFFLLIGEFLTTGNQHVYIWTDDLDESQRTLLFSRDKILTNIWSFISDKIWHIFLQYFKIKIALLSHLFTRMTNNHVTKIWNQCEPDEHWCTDLGVRYYIFNTLVFELDFLIFVKHIDK